MMSLEEADLFLTNRVPRKPMKISVDKYIQLTSELLDLAGFNIEDGPIVRITIEPWHLEVVLQADKNDEGAYPCDEQPDCWLKTVSISIDNTPHEYENV